MARFYLPAAPLLLAAAAFGAPAQAYVGALDASFAATGRSYVNFVLYAGVTPDHAHAVAIQADGRIVTVGETDENFLQLPIAVSRHLPSGVLDNSFASGGKLEDVLGSGVTTAKAFAVAIQPDGRIVVAGSRFLRPDGTLPLGVRNAFVARYTASGLLDGKVEFSLDGHSEVRAIKLQPDGKIVVAGHSYTASSLPPDSPKRIAIARLNPDLTLDASFNGTGRSAMPFGTGDAEAFALAVWPDGSILAAGYSRLSSNDFTLARYLPTGTFSGSTVIDIDNGSDDFAAAVALQGPGGVLMGGGSGANSALIRLNGALGLDSTFAVGGKFLFKGAPIVALAVQADDKILALTQDFHVWRLTANGAPDPSFGVGGRVVIAVPPLSTASAMALQGDGRIVVAGTINTGANYDFIVARIDPAATITGPIPSAGSLDFGGQSVNTRSAPLVLQISNGGAIPAIWGPPVLTPGFSVVSNGCGNPIMASTSCALAVEFLPRSLGRQTGTLSFDTPSGLLAVSLTGSGERSLVTHYYQAILRRAPDPAGKAFWNGEEARMAALGVGVNETWFAMAQQFYFSAEYAAFNRGNDAFVADLYDTFFNRAPDAGGLAFWSGNLTAGMPREVLLAQFMFSAEFGNFTRAIFGDTNARAEVDAVTDFYRGLLARLPDDSGFGFWVARLRSAQCQGAASVIAVVEEISGLFTGSAEYSARNRSNAQYVGDLYNAFLRRGGDLAGVQFWIGQLDTGAQTREQVRVQFKNSVEFQARVSAIRQQGCIP